MTGPRGGFSLIEVVVVIAVISILAAMAVPYAAKVIDQSKEEATRKEMEEIYNAIMGDPKVPTAGFLGDMGRLPNPPGAGNPDLQQINVQGTQNGPFGGPVLGIKMGWYGPYINAGFSIQGYATDAWGRNYAYSPTGAQAGQIRSRGPDGAWGTADDIVYPPNPLTFITGRLTVNLFVWDNAATQYRLNPLPATVTSLNVTYYFSLDGVQNFDAYNVVAGVGPAPPYAFNARHAGYHAVTGTAVVPGNPGPVSGQAVAYVPGNDRQATLNLYLR